MRANAFSPIALFALIVGLTSVMSGPAFALSIDRESGMNSDGTAKFTDPDEQMPNFTTSGPGDSSSAPSGSPYMMLPVSPNAHVGVTVNQFGEQQQPDAFDRAYEQK